MSVKWSPYRNPETGASGWQSEHGKVTYDPPPQQQDDQPSGSGGSASFQFDSAHSPEQHAAGIHEMLKNPQKVTKQSLSGLIQKLKSLSPEELAKVKQSFESGSHAPGGTSANGDGGSVPPEQAPQKPVKPEESYVHREERHGRIRAKLGRMNDAQLNFLHEKFSSMPVTKKSKEALDMLSEEIGDRKFKQETKAAFAGDRAKRAEAEAAAAKPAPKPSIMDRLRNAGKNIGAVAGNAKAAFQEANNNPLAAAKRLKQLKGAPAKLRSFGQGVGNALNKLNKASPFLDKILKFEKRQQMLKLLTPEQRAEIALKYQKRQDEIAARTESEIDKLAKERARAFVITSDMDQSTVADSIGKEKLEYSRNAPPPPAIEPPKIEVHVHPEIKVAIPDIKLPDFPAFPKIEIPPSVVNFTMPEQQEMDLIAVRGEDGKVARYKKVFAKKKDGSV